MDQIEFGLVVATAVLALATTVLAIVTWQVAARRRQMEVARRQLEEFYLPLLGAFRTGFGAYPDTKPAETARRILYEKYYLASPAVLERLGPARENPPLTWADWAFSTTGKVKIWSDLADTVNTEVQAAIKNYGRAAGVNLPAWELPPQWAFHSTEGSQGRFR